MKPRFFPIVFALFLALLPGRLAAQQPTATLTGTITDAETSTPLAGAHVFIAVSMIGTTTDGEGRYRLENVPLGAHRLYVSMIGFEPVPRDIMLREAGIEIFNFGLEPAVLELDGVEVIAKEDKKWQQRLERFTTLFIGETPNSERTKILNPEVLDFSGGLGHLKAWTSEPLIIENRALCYKIQYFLKDFEAETTRTRYDGEPLYEDMLPTDPGAAAECEARRREAFMGSFRHFALALLAGQVKEQGFETFSRPSVNVVAAGQATQGNLLQGRERFPIDPAELFSEGATPNEKILDFSGFVEIVYKAEMESKAYMAWSRQGVIRGKPKFQTSQINLERGPTVIDYKGDILDPYGVTFYGYLAFERVGDELPKEYRPGR